MEERQTTYKDILAEREYRKLIFSNAINRFGDSVDSLAFTWLVYQITHNATWSAIVFGLNMLPNVIVQPFAGAMVEKMNKKAVIVLTHLMRAAIIAAFALLYRFGLVNTLVMAAATLAITTVESFNLPASSAYTAQVIQKEHMTSGMSLDKTLSGAATLVGTGAAGIIIDSWGICAAMIIDILTFAAATLLIAAMRAKGAPAPDPERAGGEKFLPLFRDGIRYVLKTPVVRNFCLLCIALNFMLVPINALQAPIAEEIFKMGSELLSFAGVFGSIGSIAGASVLPLLSKRLSPLKITCIGIAALGVGIAGISLGGFFGGNRLVCYLIASVCFFVMLASASVLGGVIGIQFMKSVELAYMARASAVFNASSTAAMPIGAFLVSMAVSRVHTTVILLFSAIFAAAVLLITALARPELEKKKELPDAA